MWYVNQNRMTRISVYAIFVLALLLYGEVQAQQSTQRLSELQIEERVHAVSKELRCLVCQNQAIIDSNAPLAKQMKEIVRERIRAGDTNQEAKSYLVARYGDWILLKPPFKSTTVILWLGPFVILILILFIGWLTIYRKQRTQILFREEPLSTSEEAQLKNVLEDKS